ncbi:hypothetical protein ABG067_001037 [Albugo candida]
MENLIAKFSAIVREFRYRNHDLMDYKKKIDSIAILSSSTCEYPTWKAIYKTDLDSKLNVIFQKYGLEMEHVLHEYEREKHEPPYPRNLPPVAGNITWVRHLLQGIEEPMKKFETKKNVLASNDDKRIIRMYNKVSRTLVAFEYIWYQSWTQYIDTAKA